MQPVINFWLSHPWIFLKGFLTHFPVFIMFWACVQNRSTRHVRVVFFITTWYFLFLEAGSIVNSYPFSHSRTDINPTSFRLDWSSSLKPYKLSSSVSKFQSCSSMSGLFRLLPRESLLLMYWNHRTTLFWYSCYIAIRW